MAKRRPRPPVASPPSADMGRNVTEEPVLAALETRFHNFFRRSEDEARADLSVIEWLVYIGILLVVLVMPFLFSRLTTENFLTPKEFVSKIAIVLIAGIYFAQLFFRGKLKLARTSLDFPLALFFGFAALSVFWNFNAPSAIRDLRGTFMVLLLFPLIANVVRSRWQVELILWAAIIAALATSALGIMETYNWYFKFDSQRLVYYATDEIFAGKIDPQGYYLPLFPQLANPGHTMGSVVSTFGNRNYLGTFAMFAAFLPLTFFFYYRNRFMKLFSLGLYGFMLYGLTITRCRAALIGISLGIIYMVIMLLLNDRKFKLVKRNLIFFAVAVSLIFVGIIGVSVMSLRNLQSESIADKIKQTFTLDRLQSNTYERMWVWHATNAIYNESLATWLFGRGFGSYKHIFPLRQSEVFSTENQDSFTAVTFRQAHNDWIQVIAELGLIGLLLLLFLVYRFFSTISRALRREIFGFNNGEMTGEHVLIIGIAAAMVSQLLASIPDFPFHRIETALYAVVFLALVPVLTETDFFKRQLRRRTVRISNSAAFGFGTLVILASLLSVYQISRSWKADMLVRQGDVQMRQQHPDPNITAQYRAMARSALTRAIELDPLPGDPYLKLAQIYEQEQSPDQALRYADKAYKNINYNARSTYHSVTFRRMHLNYHLVQDLMRAYQEALRGLELTCGDARSIYYMYAGKIGLDITRYDIPAEERARLLENSIKQLNKAKDYPNFELQARASLAVAMASREDWEDALEHATKVSGMIEHRDASMLNIIGISASNLGDQPRATEALNRALQLHPGNPTFMRDLGVVQMRSQQFAQARSTFEKVISTPGVNAGLASSVNQMVASITEAEVSMAQNFMRAEQADQALPILKRIAESQASPEDMASWARHQLQRLRGQ